MRHLVASYRRARQEIWASDAARRSILPIICEAQISIPGSLVNEKSTCWGTYAAQSNVKKAQKSKLTIFDDLTFSKFTQNCFKLNFESFYSSESVKLQVFLENSKKNKWFKIHMQLSYIEWTSRKNSRSYSFKMEDVFHWIRKGDAIKVRMWLDDTEHDMNQG